MARTLRNVTLNLEEETARWARTEAARLGTTVSRLVGDLIRERMVGPNAYSAARERYFSQAPRIHRLRGQHLPTRDELHDREHLS